MKILRNLFITATLITIFVLTGCTSKNVEQTTNRAKDHAAVTKSTKTLSISEDTKNMRNAITETKEKLSVNDENGAIIAASKLEENWINFEDSVKNKNIELYGKVEGPLDAINAGIKKRL